MHQTKKGNQWHFGRKAHIGVEAESDLVHTVVGTAANVNDVTQVAGLLQASGSTSGAMRVTKAWTGARNCRAARRNGTWPCTAGRGLRTWVPGSQSPMGLPGTRLQGIGCAAHPRRAARGAPVNTPNRLRRIGLLRAFGAARYRLRGAGVTDGPCLFSCLSFPHHLLRDRSQRRGAVKAPCRFLAFGCGPHHP